MDIKYVGPHEAVEIAATGQGVVRGKTVTVPDDVGEQLLQQTSKWAKARAPRTRSNEEEQE